MKRMLLSLMVMAFTCSCQAQNTSNDKAISQSATYTLKGITLLVYCDEEEEYGLLNAEEISCYCGVNLEDIDIE